MGKVRPKVRGKKDVVDEWEFADIDRAEQKIGLKRRARRWKMIEKARKDAIKAEKLAIKNAEKMNPDLRREPNELEKAWLRCDYVLSNVMQVPAYDMMEYLRINEPKTYKYLYKIFMSKYMMQNINQFVEYFAKGGKAKTMIKLSDIVKEYRKMKGIKSKIVIKRKNQEDIEL